MRGRVRRPLTGSPGEGAEPEHGAHTPRQGAGLAKEESGRDMHPRPCGPTPKWGVGKLTWDGESAAWVDEEGNRRPADQRAQDKRSRRKTEAQKERARETESLRRARKKRLKEEEEKERRMKQALETPAGGAEGQPLDGAPPGAGASKKQKPEHRKNGYDTNNDLNQLLTQCLICPVKDRTRGPSSVP